MTKFMEALQRIEMRPKRVALPGSITAVNVTAERSERCPTATLYRVGVDLGATLMVEDDLSHGEVREYQARMIRATIANEVFGEIKAKLFEAMPELVNLKRASYRDREDFDAVVRLERTISEALDMMRP